MMEIHFHSDRCHLNSVKIQHRNQSNELSFNDSIIEFDGDVDVRFKLQNSFEFL